VRESQRVSASIVPRDHRQAWLAGLSDAGRAQSRGRGCPQAAPAREPEPFQPGAAMLQMRPRHSSQRADLARLIGEWITARVEVALAVGGKVDVVSQVAALKRRGFPNRSGAGALDSQRAALVEETVAAMGNHVERRKLIDELGEDGGGVTLTTCSGAGAL
jgi:hypothetical protein